MKNRYRLIPSVFLCLLLMNCSSDDNGGTNQNPDADTDPVQENRSPADFGLVKVPNSALSVNLYPLLEWETADDPDGDSVVYDLFLDENTNPQTLVTEDILETAYQLTNRLKRNTQYFWKIIAKDGNGGSNESQTFTFQTRDLRLPQTALTDQGQFPPTATVHEMAVEFQGQLWLFAVTSENSNALIEIWVTDDGENWLSKGNAPFSNRRGYTLTVFDGKLLVIGGLNDVNEYTSEIWFTEDGESWDFVVTAAAARAFHSTIVFNDALRMHGGQVPDQNTVSNDILISNNGLDWSGVVSNQAFSPRFYHKNVVLDNRLFIVGGQNNSGPIPDVWTSSDGANWSKVGDFNIALDKRTFYDLVSLDERLWLFGGEEADDTNPLPSSKVFYNDIWVSNEGVFWTKIIDDGIYAPRSLHDVVVFEGNLFLIGGQINDEPEQFSSDVWKFE